MSLWKFPSNKRTLDPQYESELRFHIEKLTDENMAAGMTPEEARRRAVLEFGGAEQIKEELRDVQRIPVLEMALKNFRWALRFVRKSPSFSIVVILTLALGIGANSAVFSAIDAILLRPLPFPNGDQMMFLYQYNPKVKTPQTQLAPVRLEEWNRMNSTFQGIAGYYTEDGSETSGALPEKVTQALVTPRFLEVLGISPALGRDFIPEEAHFGGPHGVLISDRFWRRRFGADPNALGKKLRIDGFSVSIVGIMPASFAFPSRDVDVWGAVPTDAPFAQDRGSTWYRTIGRLKPGVTLEQARANLETVQAQLGKQYPQTDADLTPGIDPLKETTVGGVRSSLWMLFGAVSLLLMIACTNIVALLVARGAQRQHEISVRRSLGAPRSAVVWQLLTESFVLALAGALVGLIVASAASNVFRSLAKGLPRVEEIHLDARIVLYTFGCSVLATLLCGLFPAIRGTRGNLSGALAQASRSQVSSRTPLQWFLVGVQVALAVTLLGGAGLLLRSFQALGRVSPGFEASHVLTFHVSGSWGETTDMNGLTQRIDHIIETLRNTPGVQAAASSAELPGVPTEFQTELQFAEGPSDPTRKMVVESRFVSPGYFSTMQIPQLAGEPCQEPKFIVTPGAPGGVLVRPNSFTVLVNHSFADTYLPGSNIIGRHLRVLGNAFLRPEDAGEIRGIVGDAREEGLNREPGPTVYWCISAPEPDPYYLVRTATEPTVLAETVRKKIHDIEPARSVFNIIPLEEHLSDAFGENRLRTILLTFFAVTAVSLACIGLYGTLSYSVTVRRREVGLRLALGALQGQIVKQFLFKGLAVTLLGCAAGWLLAAAFARVLSGMLYGVSPSDVATLLSVVLLMLLVSAFAALIPSLRAAHLDPMQVLREE
ncbi:MAG TPA: ABC transporter permease [Candidatus Acidoferrum sp.]|nr:ABC transporter permease [Candidatus Acidoferrum sp.]